MQCVIKYTLDTKNFRLKIGPNGNKQESWDNGCFSDNNYEGDLVTRSVRGFILQILCLHVSLQSKA